MSVICFAAGEHTWNMTKCGINIKQPNANVYYSVFEKNKNICTVNVRRILQWSTDFRQQIHD